VELPAVHAAGAACILLPTVLLSSSIATVCADEK